MPANKARLVSGFARWMAMTTLAVGLIACSRAPSHPKQAAAAHDSLRARTFTAIDFPGAKMTNAWDQLSRRHRGTL